MTAKVEMRKKLRHNDDCTANTTNNHYDNPVAHDNDNENDDDNVLFLAEHVARTTTATTTTRLVFPRPVPTEFANKFYPLAHRDPHNDQRDDYRFRINYHCP